MTRKPGRRSTLVGTVAEEVLAYTAGEDRELDLALVEYDCIGTAAHAVALSRLPLTPPVMTPDETHRIIRELVEIIRSHRRGAFRISAADQDVHLAVERRLTRRLGEIGRKVHLGRSRNDQVALDMRLYLKDQLVSVAEQLCSTVRALLRQAARCRSIPMVGRTHMQPAMPSTVGLWLAAFAEALLDDGSDLQHVHTLADRCPLGAGAGYGVPLPLDRWLEARLLGFRQPVTNVLYAAAGRGRLEVRALGALAQVMLTLSGLAADLIIFSAPEFGYVTLPEEMCTGSSIMPQKRNPDVLELMRARAAALQASVQAAAGIVHGLPSGYHRDLQEIKPLVMRGFAVTGGSLKIAAAVVGKMTINREALRRAFQAPVFAADEAVELARQGLPFRDAYRRVKERLSGVESRRPEEAVSRRTGWGAPGNLHLEVLQAEARRLGQWARAERRRFHRAVSRLLGVQYPALESSG